MENIDKLVEEIEKGTKISITRDGPKRERFRANLAYIFVIGFFLCLFVVLFIGYIKCFTTEEYKDLLLALSSILSGPLGIVLAFYFKDQLFKNEE